MQRRDLSRKANPTTFLWGGGPLWWDHVILTVDAAGVEPLVVGGRWTKVTIPVRLLVLTHVTSWITNSHPFKQCKFFFQQWSSTIGRNHNSDWRHGLEFDCNHEATLVRGARLQFKLHFVTTNHLRLLCTLLTCCDVKSSPKHRVILHWTLAVLLASLTQLNSDQLHCIVVVNRPLVVH